MQVVDDPVKNNLVNRLDDSHIVDSHMQVVMGHGLELSAREAREANCCEPMTIGPIDGFQDIRAVSRSGDGEQEIARGSKVFQLLDEHPVVSFIIGPGHDSRGVIRQAQDFEPLLVLKIAQGALGEIFAEVRCVGA